MIFTGGYCGLQSSRQDSHEAIVLCVLTFATSKSSVVDNKLHVVDCKLYAAHDKLSVVDYNYNARNISLRHVFFLQLLIRVNFFL